MLEMVYEVWKASNMKVSTPALNKTIAQARIKSPPRFPKNKICKIKYIAQIESAPPTFAMSVNNEEFANFAFRKRLENVIRGVYGFHGVPMFLKFSNKSDKNPFADKKG